MLRTAPTSWAWWLDGASPAPKPPTRDQLCAVKMSFQGLTFNTPSYGNVYWWETIAWWPNPADRQAAYVAKRAAGDTHIIIDLSGAYKEGIPGSYNDVGADYSQNLSALVALAEEAINEGFLIDLRLAGDGRSKARNPDGSYPYNDPVGLTYGHEWLMENLPRIVAAFKHLAPYIIFVPGYDGVFYGWGDPPDKPDLQPDRVMAFGKLFRSLLPNGVLGLEFSAGHIPLGEGGGDYQPGGRMQDFDVIYGEFDPFNYHQDSTWQIVGRLAPEYHRPPDQPPDDDRGVEGKRYLAVPNPRGPWFFIAFEILTYNWVRGRNSPQDIAAYRQYFADMGCRHIC